MPNVITSSGLQLNATYSVEEFQSIPGLILESWGPSTRNADYNKALDVLLERLQAAGFLSISVNIISRDLVRAFPDFSDRAIKIDGEEILLLEAGHTEELRTAIGAQQARLKVNPDSKGGNRTKRILLHSSLISPQDWIQISTGSFNSAQLLKQLQEPTADNAELEVRATALIRSMLEVPPGRAKPASTTATSTVYARDPAVKAWVLQRADGCCELCDCSAPFLREDGLPYLEVHHVKPLAEGGSDRISNTIALCPNCHRRMHHGQSKLDLREEAVRKIPRLLQESSS
ncbi:HNH endonuclease [Pseudomonas sp. LS44]|uniref:HNH endonuclease n=1 Tax=Pseudomonas sp. LS44 TaxID=1357074 RepID=UPI00215B31BE|nr:HNH endonuclease signature motif containing protein [Pseudomonas sp. LS44]UVE19406.1 HNH endonuclease [Pseudomonas sp. LS44]